MIARHYSKASRATTLGIAISIALAGCAGLEEFSQNHNSTINCLAGGAAGATAGALVASLTGQHTDTVIGSAVVGAAAGCGLALAYKNRIERLERVAEEENLKLEVESLRIRESGRRVIEAGIVAQVEDYGMFPVGSAVLTADGERQVRKLAAAFADNGEGSETEILVVGHTDATGSAEGNQRLSEQRAKAVASILSEAGIAAERMYFQGAGASRPIADNSDSTERSKNRRVEIVEVNDNTTLLMRAKVEQNNPRYLVHGTSTVARTAPIPSATPSPEIAKQRAANDTSEEVLVTTEAVTRQAEVARGDLVVDFGGSPTDILTWNLSQDIKPKSSGFSLISSAHASDLPMRGCEADLPRQSGDVFNLASGKVLATHNTTDYLPGYNNRVWAQTVNGHLVTLSPVSILQDGAKVDRQPFVQVVKGYEAGNRKAMVNSQAVANTYEGEDRVLYRVFVGGTEAPISCMDVVFSKGNAQSTDGLLFYSDSKGQSYSASFVPVRT